MDQCKGRLQVKKVAYLMLMPEVHHQGCCYILKTCYWEYGLNVESLKLQALAGTNSQLFDTPV
ncbi:hypothetical protein I7I53_07915 [Histoplasma capsulatum var. duboisii H88]|uniref:Uncharacterized protein n=1 Tax=Ajellomyces capsulatus (strain H88) TaxID=544711 RepID=A0A8A1LHB8_AJEC8|nr:hypothetical protein I7I53_07915 [Histoplasma capsulatum var. duboisii H88]